MATSINHLKGKPCFTIWVGARELYMYIYIYIYIYIYTAHIPAHIPNLANIAKGLQNRAQRPPP